jgi:diguanylate cyclase (GGDEF)-like protein/PAS domain S-box-containing protein
MKTPPKSTMLSTKELRKLAEAQLKKEVTSKQSDVSDYATKKMLHELQVHQIELEMQNEELKQARITEKLHYRYTELFEFAPIAYFAFDQKGIINQVNRRGASLLGLERNNVVGKLFSNYITAQDRDIFKCCLAKAFGDGGIQSCEILGQIGNKTLWLDIEANLGITGTDCLFVVIDITDRKKAEESQKLANKEKEKRANELVLANIELAFQNKEKDKRADELTLANEEKEKRANELALAAKVFTHAREGIMITDAKGNIIEVNDTFSDTTGYSRQECIGNKPRILQSGWQSPKFFADMWQSILKDGHWSGEIWNRRKNGEMYAEIKTISAVHDEHGITTHYVALGNDITPMKEHQNQLEHIAHYDILTNLPNRVLLADRLSQAMLQCSRHKQYLAVVFIDLDGFKAVNDSYGHDVGDELLIAISVRMKNVLREGDTLSRIGGDEFVAVLADLATVEDCEPVVERLLLAASDPVTVSDVVLNISASIGVTLYPQDNSDTDLLMRHADQAMYVAKASGKNRYHLFDTVQDDAVKVQRESLKVIRNALDTHQFVLYYQPKVNMRTGLVIGVEALIRWQHPERGLLNPIEFLPVIENNPMMIEVGEWVIDSALTQISQWQAMGLKPPLSISVNIAAVQLQQPDFTQMLTTLLAAHPDVEPRYLELEVLETSALDDVQHVSNTMNACMALGVSFALDDFGTGYSSLTYLRRLPASLIKIDQSFVRDMLDDTDDLAIVEGVIALAKSFKRDVIAEGVETIDHGITLLQLGCDLAQGYGIARPMPASDILAWVNEWKPDVRWQV